MISLRSVMLGAYSAPSAYCVWLRLHLKRVRFDWSGRLDAALTLLKAAVKAPPLGNQAESFPADKDGQAKGTDTEDEDTWPPTADELRQSDFLAVLRSCRGNDLEAVAATLPC